MSWGREERFSILEMRFDLRKSSFRSERNPIGFIDSIRLKDAERVISLERSLTPSRDDN